MEKTSLARLFLGMAAALLLAGGCSSTPEPEANAATVEPTPGVTAATTPRQAGELMLPSILKGLADGDYNMYSRDFSQKLKDYFNKTMFTRANKKVKERLGKQDGGVELLGTWSKRGYDTLLWKARYSDSKDDILYKMYLQKVDGQWRVVAFKVE